MGASSDSRLQESKMASDQKYVVVSSFHPRITYSRENMQLLQNGLDKFSNELTVFPMDECPKEQQSTVEGLFIYGSVFKISAEKMDLFPKLRVIATCGTGVDHIDVEAATKRGIKVGNSKNEVVDSTADLAFALLFAVARRVVVENVMYRNPSLKKEGDGSYENSYFGRDVTGATIGIIGLGAIGTAIVQRSKAFRMNALYYSRTRKQNLEEKLGVVYCENLKDLLEQADYVILSACYTPQTHHIIGATELSYMKPTAILINIARGGLVNQDALMMALKTKQIYAAGLDVTTPEPLPEGHPLWSLSNVILTPHIGTSTENARVLMIDTMVKNLMAGLKGEPLPSPVN